MQALGRLAGFMVGIAAESHRPFAHPLDQLIGLNALLLANHVAQDAAQQADVFHQRAFIVSGAHGRLGRAPLHDVLRCVPLDVILNFFHVCGSKHPGLLVLNRVVKRTC